MTTRWPALFIASALPWACSGAAGEADSSFVPQDGSGPVFDGGPREDASPVADSGPDDAGVRPDAASGPDAAPLDSGADPIEPCGRRTFSLTRPQAQSVWLTGDFTGWAGSLEDGAIAMTLAGGTWTATADIAPRGRHRYKFIVDGATWIEDPDNPEREDDGFGGFNSVVEVCPAGAFEVRAHRTVADNFEAHVAYLGTEDPTAARATLDHAAVAPGALVTQDRLLQVNLTGLSDGIHDLRLTVGEDSTMLKVYINESTDWRDTAMYFVMTDRFVNGDPTNDSPVSDGISHPLADYLGGDFAGIRQRIDGGYFEDLGINTLWITWPIDNTDAAWEGRFDTYSGCARTGESSTRFSGYHGYWPASGTSIEPRFGTRQELQSLVVAAHARGIRVLLDFTANHVHQDSPYFTDNPEWFNLPPVLCRDGHWDDDLREECWFDDFLPDYDFTQPAARRRVLDDAIEVAKDIGADGFRVDALKHMQDAFILELRSRVDVELEGTGVEFYLVGETFTGDPGLIDRYVGSDMLHGQFDFPSNLAIRRGLAIDEVGLDEMHAAVRDHKQAYGADAPLMSTFAGNHDIARFVSKASGDLPCGIWSVPADVARAHGSPPDQPTQSAPYLRLQMAMTYAYTVPGVPLLYYGDEVGLAGAGDPDNRRMLPADSALSAPMQANRQFIQRLGQLRARTDVLRTGAWTDALFADTTWLAYARTSAAQTAIVVLNRGLARTVDIDVSALGLAEGEALDAQLASGAVTVSGGRISVTLPPQSAEVFLTR